MGGLLKPIRKIFKKRNLKKIGIGLGVAAAALLTGGAIMGIASGVGPLAGMGAAAGKVGSALGIGSATAAPAAAAATGGAAIPAAAGAAGAASVAPTVAGAATPGAAALGSSAGAGGLASASSSLGGTSAATSAALTAAGGTALETGARTASLTRPTPVTPAMASSRPETVSPLVPGGQPGGLFQQPQFTPPPEMGPAEFANASFDGVQQQTTGGGGLLQTATNAASAAGDWFERLPAITKYSLLRFGEGAFAPTPRNSVDEQIRLEDRRRARNRAPVYRGGGFF